MKRFDFVEELADIAYESGIRPEAVNVLKSKLRRDFGGLTVTIARREPVTLERVNAALRAQKSVRTISKEMGLSRSTIYRMLSCRKSHSLSE